MRAYLTPMTGTGAAVDPNRGKYIDSEFRGTKLPGIVKSRATIMPFGSSRVCLMGAETTELEHTQLMAQSDVYAFPEDLGKPVTDASTIQAALLAFGVPHDWVRNGMTYREVLRKISGMFQLMQNMSGQKIHFPHLDAAYGMHTKAQHFKQRQVMGTLRDALIGTHEEFAEKEFLLKDPV